MPSFEYPGEPRPAYNQLALRYATPEMRGLFTDEAIVFQERGILIEVMEAQAALGLDIPQATIEDYRAVQADIDLDRIREVEEVTKQDVNARNKVFNEQAGHEKVMLGMTSRDLTETREQFEILAGLRITRDRSVATLRRFGERAALYALLPMAGRSHNVAAQTIVLAKRFSNFGEDMLTEHRHLQWLIDNYAWRGIKGAVGTQQDMLDLFDGDSEKVLTLEETLAASLGFTAIMGSVGQVYPRTKDEAVISAIHQLGAGPSSFATTLRLMAGQELVTEGFQKGQVGSNAMPHKMNTRTSERITGLHKVIGGYLDMASHISGDQWNEGDVSESVVRRVAIPDTFYAIDGMLEATMHVLDEMGAYPAIIERELERYLPFLTTTKVLTACVKAGMGRETAHDIIGKHAKAVVLDMREKGISENDLFDRLDADERIPVNKEQMIAAIGKPIDLTGLASEQATKFARDVEELVGQHRQAAAYVPRPLL